jgi:hypothetical protein
LGKWFAQVSDLINKEQPGNKERKMMEKNTDGMKNNSKNNSKESMSQLLREFEIRMLEALTELNRKFECEHDPLDVVLDRFQDEVSLELTVTESRVSTISEFWGCLGSTTDKEVHIEGSGFKQFVFYADDKVEFPSFIQVPYFSDDNDYEVTCDILLISKNIEEFEYIFMDDTSPGEGEARKKRKLTLYRYVVTAEWSVDETFNIAR